MEGFFVIGFIGIFFYWLGLVLLFYWLAGGGFLFDFYIVVLLLLFYMLLFFLFWGFGIGGIGLLGFFGNVLLVVVDFLRRVLGDVFRV